MEIATARQIKAFEKFNADLAAFGEETGEVFVTLYEDINTTRKVANFRLYKNGNLKWVEYDDFAGKSANEVYSHIDSDDVAETLKFWRAALRRAKKYFATDADTLDKMADGELPDIDED